MSDDRLPKQLFYSELSEGHRLRGRPMLRLKDTLKKSLHNCSIATAHRKTTASNRHVWKQLTRKGAAAYEQAKRRAHAEKWAATKAGTESRGSSIPCHVFARICASEFGLRSHLQVHRWTPTLVLGWTLSLTIVDHIDIYIYIRCMQSWLWKKQGRMHTMRHIKRSTTLFVCDWGKRNCLCHAGLVTCKCACRA